MWKDFILCAYGSGHIRVFGTQTWSLICEVAAHARWITATDMALETGYFLSVSEDSFAKVWQISKEDGRVSLLYNTWTAVFIFVLLDFILEFFCPCTRTNQLHGAGSFLQS
jgi:hypothetical protein